MVNKQLYQEVVAHLRGAVRKKMPNLWENQTWMLHHDNKLAHMLLHFHSYLTKHRTSIASHLPYSLDLAPADFLLFLKLKTALKGHGFKSVVTLSLIKQTACAQLSSADVTRLMLIAKQDKWQFVVKT
jgi:hypothetical protein